MNVWLDLEQTIINNWQEGLLINSTAIRRWLNQHEVGDIHIWSFAIYNDKDLKDFVQSGMKEAIERILNRKILSHPSVEQMQQMVYKYERIKYDHWSEFTALNGKQWSFIKFCLGEHPDKKCVLIDDVVPSLEIKNVKTGGEIILINVNDIIKQRYSNEQKTTIKGVDD